MQRILCAILLIVSLGVSTAYAQDTDRQLEVLRIALQRARETTAKCENDLADIWAQANELNKVYQQKLQELEVLKKQVEEKMSSERK